MRARCWSTIKKAFTLLELTMAVAIVAVLVVCVWFYSANYGVFGQSTVDSYSLKTLNDALELYKMYGGMQVADTLGGPNGSSKMTNVINALKSGITIQGKNVPFINPGATLNLSGISGSGLGANFIFSGYTSKVSH